MGLAQWLLKPDEMPLRELSARVRRRLCAEGRRSAWRAVKERVKLAGAKKVPRGDKGLCLFVTGSRGASGRYRCRYQAEALRLSGCRARAEYFGTFDILSALDNFDVFVAHAVPVGVTFEAFVTRARRRGMKVAYDVDDVTFDRRMARSLPRSLKEPRHSDASGVPLFVDRTRAAMALCDCVIASTAPLAEQVRRSFPGKPVFVNRNAMGREMVALSESPPPGAPDGPTITYLSGTATHDADFMECAEAVARVLRDRPDAILVVVGPLAIPECLAGYADRIERHPFVPWRELSEFHRRTWVNLAPLQRGNPLTACKSSLKYFEAALFGVPTAASDMAVFDRDIRDGEDGFLCADPNDWYGKITMLLEDEGLRSQMGRSARASVLAGYTTEARAPNIKGIVSEMLGRAL